ncbi:MAG: EpsG family protein [Clostridiales bacterium]|nr:EpsG family protein [Clostridiales bacterium]
MLLISLCTILIFVVLLVGFKSSRVIHGEKIGFDGEYRLVAGKGVLIAFTLVLVLTSTVRYGFIDTYAYKIMYTSVRNNLSYVDTNGWGIEAGWLYFLYALNFISSNPKLMLFLSALIINAAFVKVTGKYSSDVCFSLLIYFSLTYLNTNNGLRQYVAAAITILAFPLLQRKKLSGYILYSLFVALAYQMHRSAIVCIPLLFVAYGKPLNLRTVAALGLGLFFLISPGTINEYLADLFSESKYASYLDMTHGMGFLRALITGIIPGVLALIYVISVKRRGAELPPIESMLLNVLFMNVLFILMGLKMQYWARLGFYTSFASGIMMPKLIYHLTGKRNYKFIRLITAVCYLIFFGYNIYVNIGYGAMDSFQIDLS